MANKFLLNFNEPNGATEWEESAQGLIPSSGFPPGSFVSTDVSQSGTGSLIFGKTEDPLSGMLYYNVPEVPNNFIFTAYFMYSTPCHDFIYLAYNRESIFSLGGEGTAEGWDIMIFDLNRYSFVTSYEEYLEAIAFFAPIVPNEWVKVVLTIESSVATIEFESSVGHTEWSVDISGYSTRTINFVYFGQVLASIGDFVRLDTISITDIPVLSPPTGFYNEGDHFAYAPGDSGGTAVWREPSASSTPVTPTHRPGCGYWFKEVGTIYGGKVGPWVPWNVDQKVEFNEGSKIVKSPAVSGGTPVWEVGKTGPAITDTHVPCGYWNKK